MSEQKLIEQNMYLECSVVILAVCSCGVEKRRGKNTAAGVGLPFRDNTEPPGSEWVEKRKKE